MLKFTVSLTCICFSLMLFACSCQSGSSVTPSDDKAPPEWDRIVGITGITQGDKVVTITWDTAKDTDSEPVVYLLYIDTDSNPWDQTPIERTTNDPFTFTGLTNYQEYWCGVRCRDSADPHNADTNINMLSATPEIDLWIRTWGGERNPRINSISVDSFNNIYIGGQYSGTVDFDPGTDVESKTSFYNSNDIFLAKFSEYGEIIWVNTWGGVHSEDTLSRILTDQAGNIYVCGWFQAWVDFDPGDGVDGHEGPSLGSHAYVSKFDSNGNLIWAKTWGGPEDAYTFASGIDLDSSGNVIIGGSFSGTADFDPGAGTVEKTSSAIMDVYLSRLTTDGNFIGVDVWSGTDHEELNDVEIDTNDNAYVYGSFNITMDLNPTAGEEIVISRNSSDPDIFLVKLDSSRQYIWGKTWGGDDSDYPRDIALDNSGFIYATGAFKGSSDFDPGPGEYLLTGYSDGYPDSFLSKLDSSGNLVWAKYWGGKDWDIGVDVLINDNQFCIVAGRFSKKTDFDPGPGIVEKTPEAWDNFVSTFNLDGEFVSVQVCGGISGNEEHTPLGLAKDSSGFYYLTSEFDSPGIAGIDLKLGEKVEMYSTYASSPGAFVQKFRIPE